MREFRSWFDDLSTKPLPGGVSAAAVAAAMGAALVAKAMRVTLQKQASGEPDHSQLQANLDLALQQQTWLLSLADRDECAYRAVLETRSMPEFAPARRRAWLEATETPILISRACQSLLERASPLLDRCWPAVRPDMQIGLWLLETGKRAGQAAAESNTESYSS